jgi:hypothetical protein
MYGYIAVIKLIVFKMILFASMIQACGPEPESRSIQDCK